MINRISQVFSLCLAVVAVLTGCATRADLVRSQEYMAAQAAGIYATKVDVGEIAKSADTAIRAVDAKSSTYATKAEVKEVAANTQAVANAVMQQAQAGLAALAQQLGVVQKTASETSGRVVALDVKVTGVITQGQRNAKLMQSLSAELCGDRKAAAEIRRVANIGGGRIVFVPIGPFGLGEADASKLGTKSQEEIGTLKAMAIHVLGVIGSVDGAKCTTLSVEECKSLPERRAKSVAEAIGVNASLASSEEAPRCVGKDAAWRQVRVALPELAWLDRAASGTQPSSTVMPQPVAPPTSQTTPGASSTSPAPTGPSGPKK